MASLAASGESLVLSSGKHLIAVNIKQDREPFTYDCSKAEQKPKENEDKGAEGGSEEKGSDRILAFGFSTSGSLLALTDDNKRLILFRTEPSWECISIRWVVRRCTSLAFTHAEDQVLVADKSGDVYSFSVLEPQRPGELKLGHLSMLLALAVSPDDKYVITADRDEKIRVSFLKAPHNIQSFCLGHCEFVSCLFVPPAHPQWLLSGSGDGTVQLWEYESGRRLQSCDLKELSVTPPSDTDAGKRFAVCRIASSPDGCHVATLCESAPSVQLFRVEKGTEGHLVPGQTLTLPCCARDLTIDPQGRLWILLESRDTPVLLYLHRQGRWECEVKDAELTRAVEVLHSQWDSLQDPEAVESRFQHLYKVNFDNMASYLQRKQERIQQQKQQGGKKRAGQHPQSNGASKKAKKAGRGEAVAQASS